MRSIQTSYTFSLSSVKPLDGLLSYRAYCLEATRRALGGKVHRRERSPVDGMPLEPFGTMEGFSYARCPQSGSLFLSDLPDAATWASLLAEVNRYRHSPDAFHVGLAQSRTDNIYAPKITWIQDTLRLQELMHPKVLEVATPPSDFTTLLRESGVFADVETVDEMEIAAHAARRDDRRRVDVAVLLESLDRVDDPAALLRGVAGCLASGGLLFITALVCSGFDMAVLGLRNLYLYPPDRANCFSLRGLEQLLTRSGFSLLEASTPGVLDVEIVKAHLQREPSLPLSPFERQLLNANSETHETFQTFLQQRGLSSFARIVGRKRP